MNNIKARPARWLIYTRDGKEEQREDVTGMPIKDVREHAVFRTETDLDGCDWAVFERQTYEIQGESVWASVATSKDLIAHMSAAGRATSDDKTRAARQNAKSGGRNGEMSGFDKEVYRKFPNSRNKELREEIRRVAHSSGGLHVFLQGAQYSMTDTQIKHIQDLIAFKQRYDQIETTLRNKVKDYGAFKVSIIKPALENGLNPCELCGRNDGAFRAVPAEAGYDWAASLTVCTSCVTDFGERQRHVQGEYIFEV